MARANSSGDFLAPRPELDIDREVAVMRQMSVGELREKYIEVCGEATNSRNKSWLIKRIAWRMQANAYGGLSERALAKAREIANEADLRLIVPRKPKVSPESQTREIPTTIKPQRQALMRSTTLTRVYKGKTYIVSVRESGFECEGVLYKSLTAVAKAITGQHWNGYLFFNIKK